MKGNDFTEALRSAVAPLTVDRIAGTPEGVTFKLSDGRTIKAERRVIADLKDGDEMADYVKRVIG